MTQITGLLITGMHRSGTSLVAEAVSKLGIPLGSTLVPANEYNPHGYFEDASVVDIHDRLLDQMGRPWGSFAHTRPMPRSWTRTRAAQDAKGEITAYLWRRRNEAESNGQAVFAVKDPRLCLMFPLWRKAAESIGQPLKVLCAVRDTNAVAASLNRRDHLAPSQSRLVWLHYMSSLLKHVPAKSLRLLFDDLWSIDASEQMRRIAEFAGIDAPEGIEAPFDDALRGQPKISGAELPLAWTKELQKARQSGGSVQPSLIREAKAFLDHSDIFEAAQEPDNPSRTDGSLVRDLATYRAEHKKVSTNALELEAETIALRNQLETARQEREKLVRTYSGALDRVAKEQKATAAALHGAQRDAASETARASEFHHAYEVADSRLHEALEALASERSNASGLSEELETALKAIKELQSKDAEIVREKEALEAECENLKSEMSSLNAQILELTDERDRLHKTAVDNLVAYQTIDACNSAAQAEIERLIEIRNVREKNYDIAMRALSVARENIRLISGQRDAALGEPTANVSNGKARDD